MKKVRKYSLIWWMGTELEILAWIILIPLVFIFMGLISK